VDIDPAAPRDLLGDEGGGLAQLLQRRGLVVDRRQAEVAGRGDVALDQTFRALESIG
jgi:hypothetical protein